MGQPILRRGNWWYEQPDGSWLLWSEAAGEWQPTSAPPPPPDPSEMAPPLPAEAAQPAPQQVSQQAVPQRQAAPHTEYSGPAPTPVQAGPVSYEPAPGGAPAGRIPADSLIVSENHVVSTQQRGATAVSPSIPSGDLRVEHVAPNVTRVEAPAGALTETAPPPLHQVQSMAALKLSEQERAATKRRLEVLAGCLAPGERLAGMAMGTEQATGQSGIIAVSNRQILFIGQPGGELQLFCPLDNIELVGYEDLGGVARLSVTAQGRVTTWRDIMPTTRAAEIAQLIENRGAMAKAVVPPVEAVAGLGAAAAGPLPSSVVTAGDLSVQRYGPAPSEIVLPESTTHHPPPKREWERDWKDKSRDFMRSLFNDPGSTTQPSYRSASRPSFGLRNRLRLLAAGSILVGLISTGRWRIEVWIALAAISIAMGMSAYGQNRRSVRDTLTEGLSIGGVLVGAISLTIALLRYF